MTEKIKSEVISRRRVFSLLGLAIASGLVATIPVSPQVTPRGVELSVDQAQAVTGLLSLTLTDLKTSWVGFNLAEVSWKSSGRSDELC
jgi:hypothetical protein